VTPRVAIALCLALAASHARADSPRLAEARRAVDAVAYDDAQRLLVAALQDGDNAPAALGEIYELSARTAVVLDHPELAEQFYRRWLAIDPGATLPTDSAPKLRMRFEAAQAYIAGHGHLTARAVRTGGGIVLTVTLDPLHLARAARALDVPGATPIALGVDSTVRLPDARRIALLDDAGNHLRELEIAAEPPRAPPPERPWLHRWSAWAVPTAAFGALSIGLGLAARGAQQDAEARVARSGVFRKADVDADVDRARTYGWLTAGSTALTVACAIPTAILLARRHTQPGVAVLPLTAPSTLGLSLVAPF